MKRIYILSVIFLLSISTQAQVIYEEFESTKLNDSRKLKIQLPRNYDSEMDIEYPLVIVLDGDYMFEPVVGNIDYQSYWNDMPECIVVGINQKDTRDIDFSYAEESGLPYEDGANFFEFIGIELIPYIQNKYRASKFRIAVGHDMSANFVNFYLFKDYPVFDAYMVFSPDFSPEMVQRLKERLSTVSEETFYYLATSEADITELKDEITAANTVLQEISNPKFHYKFDMFEDANHYSLVGQGIPKALNTFFAIYKPINGKEYREDMLPFAGSPIEYLKQRYQKIEDFYGFKKKMVENDLRAVAAAAKKRDDIESIRELSKLAQKEYPDSMISAYYLGLYHEMDGNLKKALNYYQSGLLLEPSQFIDKDTLLDKIYDIKGQQEN